MMNKLLIAFCLVACSVLTANAQKKTVSVPAAATPFHKGSNTLGIGAGFGVSYGYLSGTTQSPTLVVLFDHGIIDNVGPGNIGIGGIIGFKTARYKYSDHFNDYKVRWTNTIIGARATYHVTALARKVPKLDLYGGAMLGLRIESVNYERYPGIHDDGGVSPTAGLFVGAKYNFTPNFGAFSELGYDVAFFKLGIHFNF